MAIDPGAVSAIDVHVHVHASVRDGGPAGEGGETLKAMAEYFKTDEVTANTTRDLAGYYRERNMGAVVFGVDVKGDTAREHAATNEEIAELAAENSDVLIPFASIDPARGADGVRAAKELVASHPNIRGFKFHPN